MNQFRRERYRDDGEIAVSDTYLLIRPFNNPTILIIRAMGGMKTVTIPPRNPNAAPQVEPKARNIAGNIGIQGIIVRVIPILPYSAGYFSRTISRAVCNKFL